MIVATRARFRLASTGVTLAALLTAALQMAANADAAISNAGLYITGSGSGPGVGMSQFGAAGYAERGFTYRQILRSYYAQTTVGVADPNRIVTVLLRSSGGAAFSGATTITGSTRRLNPYLRYRVVPVAGGGLLLVAGAHTYGPYIPPLQVTGPGPVRLIGLGLYHGSLVFRPNARGLGVTTVNALGLEDYVRGVVSAEMPSYWPVQALEAQAVASRTYAITDGAVNPDYGLYNNTRSQVYKGVAGETPETDAAVAATTGEVVEYDGAPVVTNFFASSGGQTESAQNVFSGISPEPWQVSEGDPYDDSFHNPYSHWNMDLSVSAATAKLKNLVRGTFQGISVLQRGASPRVVRAQVVGSRGDVTVSGARLQKDLGTPSTWMLFTTLRVEAVESDDTLPPPASTPAPPVTTSALSSAPAPGQTASLLSGGAGLSAALRGHTAGARSYRVAGTVFPAAAGAAVTVQSQATGAWTSVGRGHVAAGGGYSVAVRGPGTYRVLYNRIVGPTVRLR